MNFTMLTSMSNLIISTIVFFIVAWFANRYLDEQGIPKGSDARHAGVSSRVSGVMGFRGCG